MSSLPRTQRLGRTGVLPFACPQRQWFEIGLRVDGVWVVLPDAGTLANWGNLRGDEFPTLHQAVTHYLLTVTQ